MSTSQVYFLQPKWVQWPTLPHALFNFTILITNTLTRFLFFSSQSSNSGRAVAQTGLLTVAGCTPALPEKIQSQTTSAPDTPPWEGKHLMSSDKISCLHRPASTVLPVLLWNPHRHFNIYSTASFHGSNFNSASSIEKQCKELAY